MDTYPDWWREQVLEACRFYREEIPQMVKTTTETGEKKNMAAYLQELGMDSAAHKVMRAKKMKHDMMIAYENYRVITPEKLAAFNVKLRRTPVARGYYQVLTLTSLKNYEKVPPADVLGKLAEALERKCFDSFEVAHIETVKEDPLLLGCIEGCGDKFFIAQWDNDVKISDILKDYEG